MAGIVPGILVAAVFAAIIVGTAIAKPSLAGRVKGVPREKIGFREFAVSTLLTWPIFVMAAVIVGGIFYGFFTPTEAAAMSCFVALVYTAGKLRSKAPAAIFRSAINAVNVSGMVFLLLIGIAVFTSMLTLTGFASAFAGWIAGWGLGATGLLLVMIVVYLVLGMVMDSFAMLALTVPVLVPVLIELDISLIWFGIFAVLLAEIGALTPPVGVILYVVHGIVQDPKVNQGQVITIRDSFVAAAWLVPGAIIVLLILIAFPELATWLPDAVRPVQ